jgi:3-oxoacyl-[acyl-carrier-protein] synthase-3
MLAELAAALELREKTMHLTVDRFGNTGAASIPITLDDAVREGRVAPGANLLFIAIGGGMTWGGIVFRWEGPRAKTARA